MKRVSILLPATVVASVSLTSPAPYDQGAIAAPREVPADVIAVQLRKQGYECVKPKSATRDNPDSKPDEAVWLLECENAKYKVRLIPKQAAEVQRVDDAKAPEATEPGTSAKPDATAPASAQ